MKKSSAPARKISKRPQSAISAPKLEFPVAPDFIDPQVMLRRCAETMPWRNSRPGEKERRLAEKIPVEFVL
jgi:hypothetical protein